MTGLLVPSFLGTVKMFERNWFSVCSTTSIAPFLSNFFISWPTSLSSGFESLKGVGGAVCMGSRDRIPDNTLTLFAKHIDRLSIFPIGL